MTTVLVTGATTPVGSALVRRLVDDDDVDAVIAVGIEAYPPDPLPPTSDRLTYRQVDLTRHRNIRRMLFGDTAENAVTHVVHAAFHRRPGRQRDRALNVESTRHLLRLCERHPTVRRFVYQSFGEVYRHDHHHPTLIAEDQPLELGADAPSRVRQRVEADLTVCTRMGIAELSICVLRLAEVFAPASGSQLWDWLQSRICFRPLGYNPMVNLLSVDDAAQAMQLAVHSSAQGVFNVPGQDTLPLKMLAERVGTKVVPLPGPALAPLYGARARARGTEFSYAMNRGRFHTSDLLDGRRAADDLGYRPAQSVRFG